MTLSDGRTLVGKMNAAQMLAHCAVAMEMACGDRQKKQALLGKLSRRSSGQTS